MALVRLRESKGGRHGKLSETRLLTLLISLHRKDDYITVAGALGRDELKTRIKPRALER